MSLPSSRAAEETRLPVSCLGLTALVAVIVWSAEDPEPELDRETGGEGRGSLRLRVKERFGLLPPRSEGRGEGERGERGGEKGDIGRGEIR